MSGSDAFLTDAPCRRRRAEGGLRRDWLPHCRFRAVRNRIDSTPAGGGWINLKSGVEANARNPDASGSGLIRSVADLEDCTQMKSSAGIGFRGRLSKVEPVSGSAVTSRRVAEAEETIERILAGNAVLAGTASPRASCGSG